METYENTLRLKVKAANSGDIGYISINDATGEVAAEKDSRCYVCKSVIALTDAQDINESKVVRKVNINEVLVKLDDTVDQNGALRMRVQLASDKKEGWITIKGNAGTVYAEESKKYWVIKK